MIDSFSFIATACIVVMPFIVVQKIWLYSFFELNIDTSSMTVMEKAIECVFSSQCSLYENVLGFWWEIPYNNLFIISNGEDFPVILKHLLHNYCNILEDDRKCSTNLSYTFSKPFILTDHITPYLISNRGFFCCCVCSLYFFQCTRTERLVN